VKQTSRYVFSFFFLPRQKQNLGSLPPPPPTNGERQGAPPAERKSSESGLFLPLSFWQGFFFFQSPGAIPVSYPSSPRSLEGFVACPISILIRFFFPYLKTYFVRLLGAGRKARIYLEPARGFYSSPSGDASKAAGVPPPHQANGVSSPLFYRSSNAARLFRSLSFSLVRAYAICFFLNHREKEAFKSSFPSLICAGRAFIPLP